MSPAPAARRRTPQAAAGAAPWQAGLPPVLAADTQLVVLGSFPGVASLQAGQYYAHPRNQFWPVLGAIWGLDLLALPYPQRLQAVLARGLGLWDIYARCRRPGSLDQAIEESELNDLPALLRLAPGLRVVAHNGAESARARHAVAAMGLQVLRLPSTSPANAGWSFDRKCQAWRQAFVAGGLLPA